MFNSVQPQRWQPTRLSHPWYSPGKNTGVGCRFLLQCMKRKSESEVAQLCLILSDPMDCRLPGSSVSGIFQERILEWVAIAFSVNQVWALLNVASLSVTQIVYPWSQPFMGEFTFLCFNFPTNTSLVWLMLLNQPPTNLSLKQCL